MRNIPVIAIDGTAASGKGTLARKLGDYLGYAVLDTGLLYRCVAMKTLQNGKAWDDRAAVIEAANAITAIDLEDPDLRNAEAGRGASVVGAIPEVRIALDDFQRGFPANCDRAGAILDGRDIGTVIFPDAAIKFYVDAALPARAERRWKELIAKGEDIALNTVIDDFKIRDARDRERTFRPMKPADDALLIDTTNMTPDQVFEKALSHIREKGLIPGSR